MSVTACQRQSVSEEPPLPMLLLCPSCGIQHVDGGGEEWWQHGALEHVCVACGNLWCPSELYETYGLGCTGIGASWCPIHGDCDCPEREVALDSATCPLHQAASTHGEMDTIATLKKLLIGAVLVAVNKGLIKGVIGGAGQHGYHLLQFDSGVTWNNVLVQASERGVITQDEAVFLSRVTRVTNAQGG